MITEKNYLPILKAKDGEFRAFSDITPEHKALLRPVLEIPPIPWDYESEEWSKSADEYLPPILDKIVKFWGTDLPVFVDGSWLDPSARMETGLHPMTFIFDTLRSKGIYAIPVTGTARDEYNPDYQAAVRDIIIQDRRGVMLRLQDPDFIDPATQIGRFLKFHSLTSDSVDLLIDLGSIDPNSALTAQVVVKSVVKDIPHLRDWRSLVFAGSSFPLDLRDFGRNSTNAVHRAEWEIWLALRSSTLDRVPTYGDYTIAHPSLSEVDPRIMRISASIRYTLANQWLVFKGSDLRKAPGYTQYRTLCTQLVGHGAFGAGVVSEADRQIQGCANGTVSTGSPATWRRVGVARHLSVVCQAISAFP